MTPRPATTTVQQVVRAATQLLGTEGVEGFSMRRLGAAMGVDPMTIYHHVPNKAALFDLVVDELWSELHPQTDGSWRRQVASLAHELRRALLQHPQLVALVATRPVVTPRLLGLVDQTLGRLADQGLPPAAAMPLLDCVVAFTVGKVQGEVRQPTGGSDTTPEQAMANVAALPHLGRAMAEGYDWQPDEQFRLGLEALLTGWPVTPGATEEVSSESTAES